MKKIKFSILGLMGLLIAVPLSIWGLVCHGAPSATTELYHLSKR